MSKIRGQMFSNKSIDMIEKNTLPYVVFWMIRPVG